ncbi:MAG: hypothetical protein K1X47_02125 [Cyclobacteriaceae bacterium]|nr:hypothetical protein [Cyclobacteriaceae bacterium]
MESLLTMYEAYGESKYLDMFVRCAGNVIDRRDDFRNERGLSAPSDTYARTPTWSTAAYNVPSDKKPYAHLVHTASITYPMAKFAAIVNTNPDLIDVKVTGGRRFKDLTMKQAADQLVELVSESILFHDDMWQEDPIMGWCYKERANAPVDWRGTILALNMQSLPGKTLAQLYVATGDEKYLDRVEKIAAFYKKCLQENKTLGAKKWRYNTLLRQQYKDTLREDVTHSAVSVSFPYDCYVNQMSSPVDMIFEEADMVQFARAFSRDICAVPHVLRSGVNYGKQNWDLKTNMMPNRPAKMNSFDCSRWIPFTQFDPMVYHLAGELFAQNVYSKGVLGRNQPIPLANLIKYAGRLIPVTMRYYKVPGWLAGGVSTQNNKSYMMAVSTDGTVWGAPSGDSLKPVSYKLKSGYRTRLLLSGNNANEASGGLIALMEDVRSKEKSIQRLAWQNGTFVDQGSALTVLKSTSLIARGSFTEKGLKDIGALDSIARQLLIYRYTPATGKWELQRSVSLALSIPLTSRVIAISAGDLNHDGVDELVVAAGSRISDAITVSVIDLTNSSNSITMGLDSSVKRVEGLTAGNFDEQGNLEIAVFTDSQARIYHIKNQQLEPIGNEQFMDAALRKAIFIQSLSADHQLIILRNEDPSVVTYLPADTSRSTN